MTEEFGVIKPTGSVFEGVTKYVFCNSPMLMEHSSDLFFYINLFSLDCMLMFSANYARGKISLVVVVFE